MKGKFKLKKSAALILPLTIAMLFLSSCEISRTALVDSEITTVSTEESTALTEETGETEEIVTAVTIQETAASTTTTAAATTTTTTAAAEEEPIKPDTLVFEDV